MAPGRLGCAAPVHACAEGCSGRAVAAGVRSRRAGCRGAQDFVCLRTYIKVDHCIRALGWVGRRAAGWRLVNGVPARGQRAILLAPQLYCVGVCVQVCMCKGVGDGLALAVSSSQRSASTRMGWRREKQASAGGRCSAPLHPTLNRATLLYTSSLPSPTSPRSPCAPPRRRFSHDSRYLAFTAEEQNTLDVENVESGGCWGAGPLPGHGSRAGLL